MWIRIWLKVDLAKDIFSTILFVKLWIFISHPLITRQEKINIIYVSPPFLKDYVNITGAYVINRRTLKITVQEYFLIKLKVYISSNENESLEATSQNGHCKENKTTLRIYLIKHTCSKLFLTFEKLLTHFLHDCDSLILNLDSWSLKSSYYPFCLKSESYVTFKAQNYFNFSKCHQFLSKYANFPKKHKLEVCQSVEKMVKIIKVCNTV